MQRMCAMCRLCSINQTGLALPACKPRTLGMPPQAVQHMNTVYGQMYCSCRVWKYILSFHTDAWIYQADFGGYLHILLCVCR
jgi:hypothetical protein